MVLECFRMFLEISLREMFVPTPVSCLIFKCNKQFHFTSEFSYKGNTGACYN